MIILSIGYFTGITFVDHTTSSTPSGIVEQYNGNEDLPDPVEMKFKKSRHEMLNIFHTHLLSLSVIYFIVGILTYLSRPPKRILHFLLFEPMTSMFITFGSIYLIWCGYDWLSPLTMVSGLLMTLGYCLSLVYILRSLLAKTTLTARV